MMNKLKNAWDWAASMTEVQLNLCGVETRDDRGSVSTEYAIVIAAVVAIAVIAAGIFLSKAISNANNIPDSVNPPSGG